MSITQGASHTRVIADVNPADSSDVLGHIPQQTAADVAQAVEQAQAAYPGWRATPPPERGRVLACDTPAALKRQQINRIFVVETVDFALIRLAKRLPSPLLDKDVVPNTKMLFQDVCVEVTVGDRNNVYHASPPDPLKAHGNLFRNRESGYWEFSQYCAVKD